jgi:hypothetical protein
MHVDPAVRRPVGGLGIPGYRAHAERGYHKAEEAALRGSANVATEHSGDSGSGFVGSWNSYEIRGVGQNIKVLLNGVLVDDFVSTDPARDLAQGYVGLQNHGGGETIYYRDVRVKNLG